MLNFYSPFFLRRRLISSLMAVLGCFFLAVPFVFATDASSATPSGVCDNCVCSSGAAQGSLPSVDACNQLCLKNNLTFKSCETAAATPAPAANLPKVCTCYCATSSGAISIGGGKTPDVCLASCKKQGDAMVTCAFEGHPEQSPDRSLYCYDEKDCKKQKGILDTKQAYDCIPGQKYCYPDPKYTSKVTLNVAIPNPADPAKPLTLTGDIGEYINKMFSFMIDAGMVIAIVMVMIGGLQYTIGAASQDKGKGKDRIKNGVTGFILLLCVTLIAQTVNPYLIKLQVPKFPMIKPMAAPSGLASCEEYIKKKDKNDKPLYKLDKDSGKCGDSANVSGADGQAAVSAGISCDYLSCPDDNQQCFKGKCLPCAEVTANNESKIIPSSEQCGIADAQLKKKDSDSGDYPNQRNYCFFSRDTDLLFAAPSFQIGKDLLLIGAFPIGTALGGYWSAEKVDIMNQGTCASMTINCSIMTKCDDYDDVKVSGGSHTTGLDSVDNRADSGVVNFGDLNLEKICLADPCHLQERLKLKGPCKFDKKLLLNPINDSCDNP